MKLAIMQPYFMPYIGYFQLISSVDVFVVYDEIKYTKKGWINRNRFLVNGTDSIFSLPLKKGGDDLDVVQRELAVDFDRGKLLNKFRGAYAQAPYFVQTFSLLERVVGCQENNLFRYIYFSIAQLCAHLDIRTVIRVSSEVVSDHGLKGQDKVLELCRVIGADTYINAIGGVDLYDRAVFKMKGVELRFIRSNLFEYAQFGAAFVPWLSIIDVLMFNPIDAVKASVASNYELI